MRKLYGDLYKPLTLKDGRKLRTFVNALEFMISLPIEARRRPEWRDAIDAIREAAYETSPQDAVEAVDYLTLALSSDDMLLSG